MSRWRECTSAGGLHGACTLRQCNHRPTQRLVSGRRVERRDGGRSNGDVSREQACRWRMACGLRYETGHGAPSGSFARAECTVLARVYVRPV
jgi:hypothetical protein